MDNYFKNSGNTGGEASGEAECRKKRKQEEVGSAGVDDSIREEEAEEAYNRYLVDEEDMTGMSYRRFMSLMVWSCKLFQTEIEQGSEACKERKLPYKKLLEEYSSRMTDMSEWHDSFYRLFQESHRRHATEQRELEAERSMTDVLRQECKRLRAERDRAELKLKRTLSKPEERSPPAPPKVDIATDTEGLLAEREMEPIGDTMLVVRPDLLEELDGLVKRRLEEYVGTPLSLRRTGGADELGVQEEGLATPSTNQRERPTWAQVTGRRKGPTKPKEREIRGTSSGHKVRERLPRETGTTRRPSVPGRGEKEKRKKEKRWPNVPREAVVSLSIPPGRGTTYEEVLATAKEKVSLEELGIPHLSFRKTRSGAILLGVPGQDSRTRADCFAARLAEVTAEYGAKVTRPVRHADLRLSGVEDTMDPQEVAELIAVPAGVDVGEVKVGRLRRIGAGLSTLWVRCPLEAAVRIAKEGSLRIGWAKVTAELLPARPQRCYRCLERGHFRTECTSVVDRGGLCYRCGDTGHRARECAAAPRCPLCADNGKPAAHVLGGLGCVERAAPPVTPRVVRDDHRPP